LKTKEGSIGVAKSKLLKIIASNMPRTKIPEKTAALIIFEADRKCCVCKNLGDQIHHLDGNNSNNSKENLVLLCLNCHADASNSNYMRRNVLTKEVILHYKQEYLENIKASKKSILNQFDNEIRNLTSEVIVNQIITANIILKLDAIRIQLENASHEKREDIIIQLNDFIDRNNERITYEVFTILERQSQKVRYKMTSKFSWLIFDILTSFYSSLSETKASEQLLNIATKIGFNLFYDAARHSNRLDIAIYGLMTLKFVYKSSNDQNLVEGKNSILSTFKILNDLLETEKNEKYRNAVELLHIFENDLQDTTLTFPPLPEHLDKLCNG
jgi:hypothetical protein